MRHVEDVRCPSCNHVFNPGWEKEHPLAKESERCKALYPGPEMYGVRFDDRDRRCTKKARHRGNHESPPFAQSHIIEWSRGR